jgi:hypothetical protein
MQLQCNPLPFGSLRNSNVMVQKRQNIEYVVLLANPE